jgi:hypothetical protein
MSKNNYQFGREFKYDELRTSHNLSEVLAGKKGRKEKRKRRFI